MFQRIFSNMGDVTKNLVIINVLFFLATVVLQSRGIELVQVLGMHYPSSNLFKPYQIATHLFMHGSFSHLFFNMFGLIMFGSNLERFFGPKRYLFYYFFTAFGAVGLFTLVQGFEIYSISGEFFPNIEIDSETGQFYNYSSLDILTAREVASYYIVPMVGASGAIFGLLMAYGVLFPNTVFMLLFPPIPIKAKWLVTFYGLIELYNGFQNNPGDSVAHFAHIGGMLFGFILIKIWKRDRNHFY